MNYNVELYNIYLPLPHGYEDFSLVRSLMFSSHLWSILEERKTEIDRESDREGGRGREGGRERKKRSPYRATK